MSAMKWTEEQRRRISAQAVGKRVASLEYVEDGGYWVMTFEDQTEISFRFMAEEGP
jgi:hypothetical protein